jgi:hypothetical protein
MIEIGRRGFITGLAAFVAAPAVIRIAPLMPISSRFAPLYVPAQWLGEDWTYQWKVDLKQHAWPRRLHDTWIDINDFDPKFVKDLVERLNREDDESYGGIYA